MQEEYFLEGDKLNNATDTDVVYFTINSKYIKSSNPSTEVSDATNSVDNDDSDDERSTEISSDSSDNDNDLIRSILEDWLFNAILASPNQQLTWDEVVSKCSTSTSSSLFRILYMVYGPNGLYEYYTSQFTSSNSKIICHNHTSKATTVSHQYDTTTTGTTTSITTNTKTTGIEDTCDNENCDTNDIVSEQYEIPIVAVATSFPNNMIDDYLTDIENSSINDVRINVPTTTTIQKSSEHATYIDYLTALPDDNLLSRDSRSSSIGSFISYSSHLDIATRSIQNDYDYVLDYDDYVHDIDAVENDCQENNIVESKSNHCTGNASIPADRQYLQCEKSVSEDHNTTQPTVDLSLVQSFEYKNNTMKEWVLNSKIGKSSWHKDIDTTWKQCIKDWLLKLLEYNSTQGLWYKYVQMELWNAFGIDIPDLVLWIENEIPEVSVILNHHDGELYIQHHFSDDPITIILDAIENGYG